MANPAVDDDFKIATQAAGAGAMATLKSLGVPNPHPVWRDAVAQIKLGDNSRRYVGLPYLEWRWGFLTNAQRDVLRTYCTGASAPVYITTPTTNKSGGVSNVSAAFLCQMNWPDPDHPEDPQAGRRLEFTLTFRQMVAQ